MTKHFVVSGKKYPKKQAKKRAACPICQSPLKITGKIRQRNPLTGRMHTLQVYDCMECGYRKKTPR